MWATVTISVLGMRDRDPGYPPARLEGLPRNRKWGSATEFVILNKQRVAFGSHFGRQSEALGRTVTGTEWHLF
jgi:hypothetical protein